ncbi:MAG TPA: type II secretion system protein GspL [Desulfuromonadaceae bacterium]|jgi:general secretion pathway protein L
MDYLIIHVEEQQVTAARFGFSGRTASLVGAAHFPLGEEQDLASVARQIAKGSNGSPRIVLCLSPALFAQRTLELPLTDLRKVREVLAVQLQGEIALPIEEAVFDALPVAEGKFLALWTKKADVARAIAVFKEAGLEPQFVSSTPFSWGFLPGATTDCALCDGGAVAIIAKGRLAFIRAISANGPVRQLGSTLSALELAGVGLPPRLFVFGSQAETLVAANELPLTPELLELPVEQAKVFRNADNFDQLAGLYAVARACHTGAMPDFRRGDLAWTAGNLKTRKKLILTAILALLVILLLFVSKGLQYRAARSDLASLNNSITAIYREIFPSRAKAVDEVAEIKGEIRKLSGLENGSGIVDILKQLAEAKGATINGLYEAELEGSAVRIKGDARSAQAVNDFKASLAPLMTTIELGEVKSRPDGTVTFSLTGTLKEVKK